MLTATTLLAAMDGARFAAPAERERLEDLGVARKIQNELNDLRLARGDRPLGYKIGFTNRSIWPLYGVFQPIWAPVWDTTVFQCNVEPLVAVAELDLDKIGKPLSGFCLPRLEPEIVLGLRQAPASSSIEDVADAVQWVAHGFEIVQSTFPDWRFAAAESFAAQGLHGALLIGPRRQILAHQHLAAQLSAVRLQLICNGEPIADGEGTAVLDGPIQAFAHLVAMLEEQPLMAKPVQFKAGTIVTTGTLTDAQPLLPGQHWQTTLSSSGSPKLASGILEAPLAGLSLLT